MYFDKGAIRQFPALFHVVTKPTGGRYALSGKSCKGPADGGFVGLDEILHPAAVFLAAMAGYQVKWSTAVILGFAAGCRESRWGYSEFAICNKGEGISEHHMWILAGFQER